MATADEKHRILIVDDHPLYRDGLRRFIDSQPDLVCCGEADSPAAALRAFEQLRPELVLLDLRLRGEDALDVLRKASTEKSPPKFLVLSQKDESVYAQPVMRAGALGYIMKEEATEELLTAIHVVLQGKMYVSKRLSAMLLKGFVTGNRDDNVAVKLSERELQVFQYVGSGLGTSEIAAVLELSAKTIETYRENIKHKLRLADSASLVKAAQDWVRSADR